MRFPVFLAMKKKTKMKVLDMKLSSTDSPSYLLLSGMSLMVLRLSYSMIYTVGINTVEYEVF